MARSKARSRSRGFSMGGSGGGAGFFYPKVSVSFTGSGFNQGADQATSAGTLVVAPTSGVTVSLLDSDGGKFQLNALGVEAGATITAPADGLSQPITVQVNNGGQVTLWPLAIPLQAQSIALSGSLSIAHGAATNTVVGNLTALPSGSLTFSIVSQDVVAGFKIVTAALERDTGVLSAGAYNITIRATKGSQHWDQLFVLTLT